MTPEIALGGFIALMVGLALYGRWYRKYVDKDYGRRD